MLKGSLFLSGGLLSTRWSIVWSSFSLTSSYYLGAGGVYSFQPPGVALRQRQQQQHSRIKQQQHFFTSQGTAMSSSDPPTSSNPRPPPLVDVDCNLWHRDLQPLFPLEEQDEVASGIPIEFAILQQDAISESNIVAMLSPSSTLAEAERGIQLLLSESYCSSSSLARPRIKTTVGIHPYHVNDQIASSSLEEQLQQCRQLLQQGSTVVAAVGECGLDASEGFPPIADQIPWFRAQIELAQEFQLPLFVHERLAHAATMDLLSQTTVPVLIHCFTGTPEEMRAYIERGYYVSLSGYIFKETAQATVECLTCNLIPLDRLMIETDAPYLGFTGCRDLYLSKHTAALAAMNAKRRKRLVAGYYPNVPSALPRVLDYVLQAINQKREVHVTRDELAWRTSRNANAFFNFNVAELNQS